MNAAQYARLARAEARKLFTTRAVPAIFAAAIALTLVSVLLQAAVAGQHGKAPLGTDKGTYQLLMIGVVPVLVMLAVGIIAAGGEFRHRTIIPMLLVTPGRVRVFAVKVLVVAVAGAVFSAVTFGSGLAAVVAELSAHHLHHLPSGTGSLYGGTVIASTCFGMIGVAVGALTRNTVGAIVAAMTWAILIEEIILQAVAPSLQKYLPAGASVALTVPAGGGRPDLAVAGLLLAGYAAALLLVAGATSLRRDIA